MASTQLSDVIVPDIYLSYEADNSPEKSVLVTSGVAVTSALMTQIVDAAGITGFIPFWRDLDQTVEPNYSTDSPTDVAVPNKIVAGTMQTRKINQNQGYSAADLVNEIAGSNPMMRIRNRFGKYWERQFQRRIIATLQGVVAGNILNNGADMVNNIAIETGLTAGPGNIFSRAAFTTTAFTMGDMFDGITTIAVHSVIYKRMIDNDDIAFIQPAVGQMSVPTFLGRTVVVDDTMPVVAGITNGFKYTSYLFGPGAIGYGQGNPLIPVEVYRRPDQGNGGGVEQLWERKTWIVHPFGFTFNNVTVTGQSPTFANLRLAANWTRTILRKNVPLAVLITNG